MKRQLCSQCDRPLAVCFCHNLKSCANHWPVWILQHPAEKKHAIGTAKIAILGLNKVLSIDSQHVFQNEMFQTSIQSQTPILVYPGENSKTLEQLKTEETRPLLFLDGSWRKTRKMLYDFPALTELPRVAITPEKSSRYRIRKEPNESAISTLEAIVHVLSILENNDEKYQSL
ncbi:MAG: DTW domain-containing protein, partial [Gammaproteobacteria bacterium]|nr:DTW domain-containing protein [Gammaproteobacteria bacterium]